MNTLQKTLQSSLTEARFNLVLIRGEAGMGKTRLLTEFLKVLPPDIPRYMAHGSSVEGTPAFWPWTKILREALAAQKGTNRQLVENAQSLSTAFPEIQHSVDTTYPTVASLDRFSILSHWARTIRSISRNAPLVLALEDLHRADFSSLALINWIAEELSFDPVVILATHRPSIETTNATRGLSEIASLPRCTNIDLSPLTAEDISCLLDPLSVDRATLSEALRSRTMGNAFYVTHLIRFIDARPDSESTESLVSALPSNGKEIVDRQLSDLPADTRDALAVASVAGRFFSVQTTAEILGIDGTKLLARLEPARLGWIIREEGRQFEFSHALLQEALYQSIESSRRREIHHHLARHLIGQSDSHSSLISDHLLKAIPLAEPSEARFYAIQAGRDAATRFAYAEAQTFFRRALDLLDSDPESTPTIRCEILLEYANAQLYTGDREDARRTLLDAANLARQTGSPQLLAACALQLAPDYLSIEVGAYDLTLIHLTEEAIAITPSSDPATRSTLLARLSQAIGWLGAPEQRRKIVAEALALARDCRDANALSAALSAQADFLASTDRAKERIRVLNELRRVMQLNNETPIPARLVHHTRMISALLEVGEFARLDAENDACRELASRTEIAHFIWYPESTDSMRSLMKGNLEENKQLADRFTEIQRLSPDSNVIQGYASQQFYRQIER
ncbi:MAG TPA: hypothetical protein ENI85_17770, partial [Deltaproteobacteria bacterium]|nr:hypothetical protein [Deltaproteobacteria bacterium]